MRTDDFARLAQHLSVLQKTVDDFCGRYGFREQTTGLGRYPRKRITRLGHVNLFFDLQMDLTERGEYYEVFSRTIPYSMGVGAWVDSQGTRYSTRLWCFQRLPFNQVREQLAEHLEKGLLRAREWTRDRLIREGEKSTLSPTTQ